MELVAGDVEVREVVVLLFDLDVAVGEVLVLFLDSRKRLAMRRFSSVSCCDLGAQALDFFARGALRLARREAVAQALVLPEQLFGELFALVEQLEKLLCSVLRSCSDVAPRPDRGNAKQLAVEGLTCGLISSRLHRSRADPNRVRDLRQRKDSSTRRS